LFGWIGKILRVDLSSGEITTEPLAEDLRMGYIGGRGINSKLLYDETSTLTDPLGPENRLIIGTSPLTGTLVPTASRFTITAKSPLTNIRGDANSGGAFAPEVKYAGYDFIIIQGASEKPVYIFIDDDNVQIRDASFLWGKNTSETDRSLKKQLGDSSIKVLAIGQAGENLVKIAGIVTGINIAARCGLGAVMGSKRLKAIAVRGSGSIKIADPGRLLSLVESNLRDFKNAEAWSWYPKLGWTAGLKGMGQSGCAPVKNYLLSGGCDFEKRECFFDVETSPEYDFKDVACYGCPLACNKLLYSKQLGMKKAPVAGTGHMPIWEIYDYPYHVQIIDLCEAYGLDVYSVQLAVSAAMEWFEKGIINTSDTDGLELRFGNKDAAMAMVHKIAKREGFGDTLAEGSIGAGKIIGADPDTTPSCGYGKGMDHGPIDCTAMAALTLALSVATRGAGHLHCTPPMAWGVVIEVPEKWLQRYRNADAEDIIDKPWICHPFVAEIVTYFEKINTSSDIIEICKNTTEYYYFYGYEQRENPDDLQLHAEWLKAVTGIDIDRNYLENVIERVVTLEKAYNVLHGKLRGDDMPSRRFLKKRVGGNLDGKALDKKELSLLFDRYYEIHGWDAKTSIPEKKTLEKLGLGFVIEEFGREKIPVV